MKSIILILSLLICGSVFAQESESKLKSTPINIGESIVFHSNKLNEDRTVLIHDPNAYLEADKQSKFGVIYVLDGPSHLRYLVGLLHRMGGEFLPKMIVVAVAQNDRRKDLGPEGFDDFNYYLEKELMPYIKSNYKTTNDHVLIGHSLGGLFTISTLLQKDSLFNAFISIDPYMVDQDIPKKYLELIADKDLSNRSLYLTSAKTFPDNFPNLDAALKDTSEDTAFVREINELSKTIATNTNGLKFSYDHFGEEVHMSVPNISMYHGMKFIYKKPTVSNTNQENEVMSALDKFLRAFENGNFVLMEALMTEGAYIFPRTIMSNEEKKSIDNSKYKRIIGLDPQMKQVINGLRESGEKPPYMKLEPKDLKVTMLKEAAIVTFHLENGQSLSRRTIVLSKEEGRWKIIHIHPSNVVNSEVHK